MIGLPPVLHQYCPTSFRLWESKYCVITYPQHVLATKIFDDITRLYKFENFGSSYFPSVFVAHSDDLRKIWHEYFGHISYLSLNQLCNQEMVTILPLVSVVGESPCGQVDSLLVSRLLRLRKKSA
jgi:hypothetical protein